MFSEQKFHFAHPCNMIQWNVRERNKHVKKYTEKYNKNTSSQFFSCCLCFHSHKLTRTHQNKNNNMQSKRFCTARCEKGWNLLDYINYDHRHKSSVTYYISVSCSFVRSFVYTPSLTLAQFRLAEWFISLNLMVCIIYADACKHENANLVCVRVCVCVYIYTICKYERASLS